MHLKRGSLAQSFLSYYKDQTHIFFADLLCAFLAAGIDLAFPQILRTLAHGLFSKDSATIINSLWWIALGLIVMFGVRCLCRYFVIFWGHVMGARMESRMREDLFAAYQRMSLSYFDKHKSGDLMSRLVSDLFDISEAAHHGPEYLIVGVVQIIGSFVVLSFINVYLTLALAAIALLLVVYNTRANIRMRSIYTENRVRISGVNSRLEDSLQGTRVVKSFAAEEIEKAKFRTTNNAYLDSKTNMYRAMGRYQTAIAVMIGALYTTVVVLGGYLISQGTMSAVDLATYALYITLFVQPITAILDFTETFQKAIAGFKRFHEVIMTQPDIEDAPGAIELQVERGAISYQDVSFAYEKDENVKAVISHFNLEVPAGKTVALVGPSGAGKSTVCALLPRFYDVDSGAISIDGHNICGVTQKSLRESIGVVHQDVYLFDGTIAENIAYGCPDATLEEIHAAAEKAHIADFIESLPQAYNTPVGERGNHLSGGQKQRIAIARVFLKNPPILIFDEATSALDNESEQAVQQSLQELAQDRTTLVIAHRLSTIKNADVIVTMEAGQVSEIGTHEELIGREGTYARYYQMQFSDGSVQL